MLMKVNIEGQLLFKLPTIYEAEYQNRRSKGRRNRSTKHQNYLIKCSF
jgi:hypothetical protein